LPQYRQSTRIAQEDPKQKYSSTGWNRHHRRSTRIIHENDPSSIDILINPKRKYSSTKGQHRQGTVTIGRVANLPLKSTKDQRKESKSGPSKDQSMESPNQDPSTATPEAQSNLDSVQGAKNPTQSTQTMSKEWIEGSKTNTPIV
jgi:hypothetical protein